MTLPPPLTSIRIENFENLEYMCSKGFQHLTSLQQLQIYVCPKLSSLPEKDMLLSLKSLHIYDCPLLEEGCRRGKGREWSKIAHIPSVRDKQPGIFLINCPVRAGAMSVVACQLLQDCEMLNRLPEILHAFTFLSRMRLKGCPGLVCFAESNFPPALKELGICTCENLQYLVDEKENNNKSMSSNTCVLERLAIMDCPSLIWLSSRGDMCNRLQCLIVHSCPKLSSLFLNAKLPVMLKHLDISGCPVLECIAQDFHETVDLESIRISNAENIKSLPRGLDKLSHPQKIEFDGCPSLVSFEESGLPTTKLRVLKSLNCENFGALPKCINSFTSLRELKVWECSAELRFPEEGFPTNFTSLKISNAPRIYTSLVEWGFNRLTSLQTLKIDGEGCSHVVSFPEEGIGMMLPPSLTSIRIQNFRNLEYMYSKGFQQLTSLQQLAINDCPRLTSLPEKDMLLSLERLYIHHCPLLEEGCSRCKGREWSKIAHIPYVRIQGERVIPRELD
ncbi:hypothetical protein Gogos_015835 [Gossypium gossypioides]|uniref:Disease resistance protein n=1 Tax=Gossypium gossypioides TaxID=34282 RepID=A0A7J9C2Z7_GOSGO|nr:hypothetical protein [Gossypium gossypioides]